MATLIILLNASPPEFPINSCPVRLAGLPLNRDATISRIPAPPIITVSTVCRTAAVFAPSRLIAVITAAVIMATHSQEA